MPSRRVLRERIGHERELRQMQHDSDVLALDAAKRESDLRLQALAARISGQDTDIRALREAAERAQGRESGSRGVTSWLAPNLPGLIALAIALYLAFVKG